MRYRPFLSWYKTNQTAVWILVICNYPILLEPTSKSFFELNLIKGVQIGSTPSIFNFTDKGTIWCFSFRLLIDHSGSTHSILFPSDQTWEIRVQLEMKLEQIRFIKPHYHKTLKRLLNNYYYASWRQGNI